MNEAKKGNSAEAVVVLIFLFALFVFLLFKYGKSDATVFGESAGNTQLSRQEIFENLKNESNSDIYNKYIEEIFKNSESGNTNINTTEFAEKFKQDLENKVMLPEHIISLRADIVGNSYNEKAFYLNEFEKLFLEFRKKGGFSESKIFLAQLPASSTNEYESKIITLSDYDRETLLRIATEYEFWSDKILNLSTPVVYEDKSLNAAKDALDAAYILKKIAEEKDEQVYPLWIGKYLETVFDIIANRYAK